MKQVYQREDHKKGKIYTLLLENDTNTFGYNQWFYFKATSKKTYSTLKVEIVNLRKSFSLFHRGMKVAIFSENMFQKDKLGWHRGGNNIDYDINGLYDEKGYRLSTLCF